MVRDSLRQTQAREAKLEALRAEIQKGLDSGPGEAFDAKTLAEDVKQRGRERLAAERAAASKLGGEQGCGAPVCRQRSGASRLATI